MDPITATATLAFKLLVALFVLVLVAHAWLAITVVRRGERTTRRYLNALGCNEDSILGKLMLHLARPGLRL